MPRTENELIASLLINTKRKNRQSNLLDIANDIVKLANQLGDLNKVSSKIGISTEMLKQFLSVLKMSPKIQALVKERKIDSVSFIKYVNRFSEKDQFFLIDAYLNGKINTQDLRALGPLRSKESNVPMSELIKKLVHSKNIKVSVAFFELKSKNFNKEKAIAKIIDIIGQESFVSFVQNGFLGKLSITPDGEKKIRIAAKNKRLSLSKYIQSIFNVN